MSSKQNPRTMRLDSVFRAGNWGQDCPYMYLGYIDTDRDIELEHSCTSDVHAASMARKHGHEDWRGVNPSAASMLKPDALTCISDLQIYMSTVLTRVGYGCAATRAGSKQPGE